MTDDWTGRLLDLEVGSVAHGGVCVARVENRVVFVRHTLPGERVRASVTEDRVSHVFADAVGVLVPSPERVPVPCPHAGPGRCGGCDWQHATGPAQRRLKAETVREQFARIARLDVDLAAVEELPGGLLGWRTRVSYAVGPGRELGLRRHRSHEIEPLTHCPLGVDGVSTAEPADLPPADRRGEVTSVEYVRDEDGAVAVLAHRAGPRRQARGRRPPDTVELVRGPERLHRTSAGRDFEIAPGGFWQVHPAALAAFTAALLAGLDPQPGDTVLELYAGAGALTWPLADAVGPSGRVISVESSAGAVRDARHNLADLTWVDTHHDRVAPARLPGAVDVVVVDPPRAGVPRELMSALLGLGARAFGYVSCNPATLARDVRVALDAGWQLASLRAFDAFPMTHHVECVAVLINPGAEPREDRSCTVNTLLPVV